VGRAYGLFTTFHRAFEHNSGLMISTAVPAPIAPATFMIMHAHRAPERPHLAALRDVPGLPSAPVLSALGAWFRPFQLGR
jgi:hypothetical protein